MGQTINYHILHFSKYFELSRFVKWYLFNFYTYLHETTPECASIWHLDRLMKLQMSTISIYLPLFLSTFKNLWQVTVYTMPFFKAPAWLS